jgi:hypothetical protein
MRWLGCALILLVGLYAFGLFLLFTAPVAGVIVLVFAALLSVAVIVALVEALVAFMARRRD